MSKVQKVQKNTELCIWYFVLLTMFYLLFSYPKFLWRSTNKHGIHSPFVYQLVTQGFNAKISDETIRQFTDYNNFLRKNKTQIRVTDFGAGSKVFRSNLRKVSDIARYAGTPLLKQKLVYKIMNHLKCKEILELGTSLGMGSLALAMSPENQLTTLEGCPETAAVASETLKHFGKTNITVQVGKFEDILPNFNKKWDAVFMDGGHNFEKTWSYFEMILPQIHNDTVIILDDIYLNKEMTSVWQQLKKHPQVTISIDIFHYGLLFFRKEQTPESFIIRV